VGVLFVCVFFWEGYYFFVFFVFVCSFEGVSFFLFLFFFFPFFFFLVGLLLWVFFFGVWSRIVSSIRITVSVLSFHISAL